MARYLIAAVALEANEVSRCRIHQIKGGNVQAPQYEPPGKVVDAADVVNMITPDKDEIFVIRLRDGHTLAPERVRVREDQNGNEFLESYVDGNRTDTLLKAPRLTE